MNDDDNDDDFHLSRSLFWGYASYHNYFYRYVSVVVYYYMRTKLEFFKLELDLFSSIWISLSRATIGACLMFFVFLMFKVVFVQFFQTSCISIKIQDFLSCQIKIYAYYLSMTMECKTRNFEAINEEYQFECVVEVMRPFWHDWRNKYRWSYCHHFELSWDEHWWMYRYLCRIVWSTVSKKAASCLNKRRRAGEIWHEKTETINSRNRKAKKQNKWKCFF